MNQLIRQNVYVMRLWHEAKTNHDDQQNDAWRVTITDTRSQEKFHFADFSKLVAFLKEKLEE